MYKIEKNIPIIKHYRERVKKYPLDLMEINDSFFVPNKDTSASALGGYLSMYFKRNNKKFITRKVDGGFRVWRII
jgi:hypothetical protein